MSDRRITVVAGVIERDGEVLICQRGAGQRHALQWEFPGGKVEAGETPEEALTRELDEELGIRAAAGEEIARYPYQYPGRPPIELVFFRVPAYAGEPTNRIFEQIRWERRERLGRYDFLDGDVEFLKRFVRPGA